MGKFEDLLDLLLADDDDEDMTVEIHMFDNESKEEPKEETKEEPKEESKGKHEPKSSEEEDEEEEVLRKKAIAQHKSIIEEFGKETADKLVDYAAACAMITALLRQNVPFDPKLVDEYNAICEDLYPEHCTPIAKRIMYMALREMVNEGKKSLE